MPGAVLIHGDARALPLADGSVQCVVTSPPYWGLRDYGIEGPLGLERTPEEYVAHLVEVFREVRRVLRDDGTCWLVLGDSYATGAGKVGDRPRGGTQGDAWAERGAMTSPNRMPIPGLKPKDLVGIPWRVAFALQADDWWLRSDIIWSKSNPMPESITDRPTKSHEYVFLLTKSARYYYDAEAIKEPATRADTWPQSAGRGKRGGAYEMPSRIREEFNGSRNRRSVWTIATEPYPEAHFATFPEALVEPCILAGTSERGACPTCGATWEREVERGRNIHPGSSYDHSADLERGGRQARADGKAAGSIMRERFYATPAPAILGWSPSCACPPADPVPCRVLDPFAGSGTTVAVAERLGRVGIGVELKPAYLALARRRTVQAGLL